MCEKPTLSLVLQNGDGTAIAVIIGADRTGFVLGILSAVAFAKLRRRRPSNDLRGSFVQTRPTSAHAVKAVVNREPYTIPISPRPSSIDLVGPSVKPPRETYRANESSHTLRSYRLDRAFDTAKSVRHTASEDSTVYNASITEPAYNASRRVATPGLNAFSSSDTLRNVDRRPPETQLTRTSSEPSRALTINAVPRPTPSDDNFRVPIRTPLTAPVNLDNSVQRAKSDASGARYSYSSHQRIASNTSSTEHRRQKAVSSPPQNGVGFKYTIPQIIEMPAPPVKDLPVLPPPTPSDEGALEPPSMRSTLTSEQGADLSREFSNSQAASFYQAQAKRHLSLPFRGPRSSPSKVLPDSPNGAIGGEDSIEFSFARGGPRK